MPERLEATYRIVTPMFIGDANQNATGISPAAVKGALRFWWRALNWGRIRSEAESDEEGLQCLHAEESRIFGAMASGDRGGQSCFTLRVQHTRIHSVEWDFDAAGIRYLAGMGLSGRRMLPAEKEFHVKLLFRPGTKQSAIQSMREVLRIFGLLGGLGSRVRRGFGSVTGLVEDDGRLRLPTDNEIEADCEWLKTRFSWRSTSPFSALDGNTLFYRSREDFNSFDEAMKNVGSLLNRYRTSGTSSIPRRGAPPAGRRYVFGDTMLIADLNFYATDHHHVHAIASSRSVTAPHDVPPERSIFGLPHPYRFASLNGTKVCFDYGSGATKGRRASPLLIHVTEFANNQGQTKFRLFLLLLRAQFLPQSAQLSVSMGRSVVGHVPAPSDYRPIQAFLATYFTAC